MDCVIAPALDVMHTRYATTLQNYKKEITVHWGRTRIVQIDAEIFGYARLQCNAAVMPACPIGAVSEALARACADSVSTSFNGTRT
jgi:hypothetical protein